MIICSSIAPTAKAPITIIILLTQRVRYAAKVIFTRSTDHEENQDLATINPAAHGAAQSFRAAPREGFCWCLEIV